MCTLRSCVGIFNFDGVFHVKIHIQSTDQSTDWISIGIMILPQQPTDTHTFIKWNALQRQKQKKNKKAKMFGCSPTSTCTSATSKWEIFLNRWIGRNYGFAFVVSLCLQLTMIFRYSFFWILFSLRIMFCNAQWILDAYFATRCFYCSFSTHLIKDHVSYQFIRSTNE